MLSAERADWPPLEFVSFELLGIGKSAECWDSFLSGSGPYCDLLGTVILAASNASLGRRFALDPVRRSAIL